jgi:hypothetical protein
MRYIIFILLLYYVKLKLDPKCFSDCIIDDDIILDYPYMLPDCEMDDTGFIPSYDLTCVGGTCSSVGYSNGVYCQNFNVKNRLNKRNITTNFTIQFNITGNTNENFWIQHYSLGINMDWIGPYVVDFTITERVGCTSSIQALNYMIYIGTGFATIKTNVHQNNIEIFVNDMFIVNAPYSIQMNYTCTNNPYDRFLVILSTNIVTVNNLKMFVLPYTAYTCFGISCNDTNVCNGNGQCITKDVCLCDQNSHGLNCNNTFVCTNDNCTECYIQLNKTEKELGICKNNLTVCLNKTCPVPEGNFTQLQDQEECCLNATRDLGIYINKTRECKGVLDTFKNPFCNGTHWTNMSFVCNGHGICVAPNACNCGEGWFGLDCQHVVLGNNYTDCYLELNKTKTELEHCEDELIKKTLLFFRPDIPPFLMLGILIGVIFFLLLLLFIFFRMK